MAAEAGPTSHLVLAGGGHSHVLLLRRWIMRPASRPPDSRISLVSRRSTALYSGMVPGLVAGLYSRDDCAIDLRQLCTAAGVIFLEAEITGLEPSLRRLELAGRPALPFDRLSLDVGAVTAPGQGSPRGMPVKPLEPFLDWASALRPGRRLLIRGGGAAAVELALAFQARGMASQLLLRGRSLHLESPIANRIAERLLTRADVPVEREVDPGRTADLDCTGSVAPGWLRRCGLRVDGTTGRVLTEPSLAVLDHPHIFASGDCGLIQRSPRPPSGVWAVRAAPVLAENLRRSLMVPAPSLRSWRPRRRALQLLGDGGGWKGVPRAMACFGPWALGPNRWIWRWKDWIDRRFMDRFGTLHPMASGGDDKPQPACRGCAAKLAAAPLQGALSRLDPTTAVPPAEDAAVVGTGAGGELLLQSVDGFPALVEDPWLNARLTTLHACTDLWACGAGIDSVQTLVTLPPAASRLQEDLLLETLAGVRSVLDPLGARLIGGHTLESPGEGPLALALTVNGSVATGRSWAKGPLRGGEALLLSRPIGTGVLFAAAMAGQAHPDWIDAALHQMQQSQAPLVALLRAHGCRACTDITGFGLLGHLGEMVTAADSTLAVHLSARAIPALPGAVELLEQGLASTLAPQNASALALLDGVVQLNDSPSAGHQGLLIDPQTCGPLLAVLPAERAEAALEAMRHAGFSKAALIATVSQAHG